MVSTGKANRDGQRREDREAEPLLAVSDLRVRFRQRDRQVDAVRGISYEVSAGSTLAIIGESGSGKTASSRALMGLLPATATVSGSIRFADHEMVGLSEREWREHRGPDVAMVFQDPARSLNPTMRIGAQIAEAIRAHEEVDGSEAKRRVVDLLRKVRLSAPEERFYEYPHQLSGGMRQRVMIAMALACNPRLLIADEATTALDVTTQAQIMKLLKDLQAESGMAVIMISHDLSLAASYADEVIVMYAGQAVERAPTQELFDRVQMPYTAALLDAVPKIDSDPDTTVKLIGGRPPDLSRVIEGCVFAPRCPVVRDDCKASAPELEEHESGHWWACKYPVGASEQTRANAATMRRS